MLLFFLFLFLVLLLMLWLLLMLNDFRSYCPSLYFHLLLVLLISSPTTTLLLLLAIVVFFLLILLFFLISFLCFSLCWFWLFLSWFGAGHSSWWKALHGMYRNVVLVEVVWRRQLRKSPSWLRPGLFQNVHWTLFLQKLKMGVSTTCRPFYVKIWGKE